MLNIYKIDVRGIIFKTNVIVLLSVQSLLINTMENSIYLALETKTSMNLRFSFAVSNKLFSRFL